MNLNDAIKIVRTYLNDPSSGGKWDDDEIILFLSSAQGFINNKISGMNRPLNELVIIKTWAATKFECLLSNFILTEDIIQEWLTKVITRGVSFHAKLGTLVTYMNPGLKQFDLNALMLTLFGQLNVLNAGIAAVTAAIYADHWEKSLTYSSYTDISNVYNTTSLIKTYMLTFVRSDYLAASQAAAIALQTEIMEDIRKYTNWITYFPYRIFSQISKILFIRYKYSITETEIVMKELYPMNRFWDGNTRSNESITISRSTYPDHYIINANHLLLMPVPTQDTDLLIYCTPKNSPINISDYLDESDILNTSIFGDAMGDAENLICLKAALYAAGKTLQANNNLRELYNEEYQTFLTTLKRIDKSYPYKIRSTYDVGDY